MSSWDFSNKKPDLIITSSPQLPACFLSLLISKMFSIPLVFEVRDHGPGF